MTVKISKDGKSLEITIPMSTPAPLSTSGKTKLVASTRGNMATEVQIEGKTLTIGLNATIPAN